MSERKDSNWQSVTKQTFKLPKILPDQGIGKRQMMLMKYFRLRAAREILEEAIQIGEIEESHETEYVKHFCKPDFKPFIENINYNEQEKHSLYKEMASSFYKQEIDRGKLKNRFSVSDSSQPFRKSCSFTTPLEFTLREINY